MGFNYDNQQHPSIMDLVPIMDISTADQAAFSLTSIFRSMNGHLNELKSLITNPDAAAGSHEFKIPRFMDNATAGELTAFHSRLRTLRDDLATAVSNMRLIFVDADLEM